MSTFAFIPGLLCDQRAFSRLAPLLERSGKTTAHLSLAAAGPALADMARMVIEETSAGVVLVGHSLGGIVALTAAILNPDHFSRVVLLAAHGRPDTVEKRRVRLRQVADAFDGHFKRVVTDELKAGYASNHGPLDPDVRSLVTQMAMDAGPAVFQRQSLALAGRTDLRPRLNGLKTPLQVIAGERDQLVPVEACAETARMAASGTLEIVPGVGHLLPLETPDRIARTLLTPIGNRRAI
jgi:pimeloyl-ACP methyl ester carboxylesterase